LGGDLGPVRKNRRRHGNMVDWQEATKKRSGIWWGEKLVTEKFVY